MSKTDQEKEIVFPLSKKLKDQFVSDFEKIFLRKPANSMKEESLVKAVNENREKLNAAQTTPAEPEQETIQTEESQEEQIEGNVDGKESAELIQEDSAEKIGEGVAVPAKLTLKEQEEFNNEVELYEKLFGVKPEEKLTVGEIAELNIHKLGRNNLSIDYFNLFGKQPLPDMTNEQIDSANQNEFARLNKANSENKTEKVGEPEFDFNPETQMVIVSKKTGDKKIINKGTFSFLKGDYDEFIIAPNEVKNLKK